MTPTHGNRIEAKRTNNPLTRALIAYGIDPMRTPDEIHIEISDAGIAIDQIIGDPATCPLHEDAWGSGYDFPTRRVFFPHPKETP